MKRGVRNWKNTTVHERNQSKKFDRKPLESLFSMLESTLLKRKWGSKCYLVMVFYNEALK